MFSGFEKIIQATVLNWWVGPDRPGIFGWALGWEGVFHSFPKPQRCFIMKQEDSKDGYFFSKIRGNKKGWGRWSTETLKKNAKAKPPFTKLVTFPPVSSWCFFGDWKDMGFAVKSLNSSSWRGWTYNKRSSSCVCFLKWWYPHFTPQNDHV